jgi:hypothetical protein
MDFAFQGHHELFFLRRGIATIGFYYSFKLHEELFGVVLPVVLGRVLA